MLSRADQAAVQVFPELQRLIVLRGRPGWQFRPEVVDDEVTALAGIRAWPQGYQDKIHIEGLTDASALRVDHTGAVTWAREGSLAGVICAVIDELVSPDDDLWAPPRGRGFAELAPGLWKPS